MGKIGDLWVRLGLKSDDYKKGMNKAQQETKTFGQKLQGMKAGALAVWAAIGAGVTAFAKDFVTHTNKIGDAWNRQMSAMKAGYHSFIADMSNYKPDTSSIGNFFKGEWNWIKQAFGNAKDAGAAAKEMTKAFDAEFELVNSVKLQRQAIQEELNQLYITMRDVSLGPNERMAAANRYKALLQPIADAEVEVYGNMLKEAVKAWQAGNQLDREYSTAELTEFFTKIGTEYEAMEQKFPDLMRVYETRKGDAQNQIIFDTISKLQQAAAQMSDIDRVLSRSMNSIKAQYKIESPEKVIAELQKQLNADYREMNLEPIILDDLFEVDMSGVENDMDAFLETWRQDVEEMVALNNMLSQSIVSSISGGVQEAVGALFELEDADASRIMGALLEPFAQTAIQLGEMLIAQGTAVEAFKTSLESLQGYAAIAAGVALIAVGTAMRAGIKSLANGPSGSTSASVASSGTGGDLGTYDAELTINVVGTISGSDIILAGEKTLNKWSR